MGNDKNSSQETVTVSTTDPQKIKNLETKLAEKEQEIQVIKEKTTAAIKRIKEENKTPEIEIKTDLRANIIKQDTFKHGFRNGYADGTVEKATKKLRAESRKAAVAK